MDENEATPVAVLAAPARSAALSPEDVADAKAAMEATYGRPDVAGVCVADGFGVKVRVEGRALSLIHICRAPCRRESCRP